jgi:hypothetical protein
VADAPDTPDPTPVERLNDHLDEVSDKPDEMQERLDELGESIEATRRQAQADDLLPDDEERRETPPDDEERRETPPDDADFDAGG